MTPDELRELRQELRCTARELAATLGIDSNEVADWELGERFPTKKHLSDLAKLRLMGPSAITRKPKRRGASPLGGAARLADPAFWQLIRKIAEHPELYEKVRQIAAPYADPAESAVTVK